MKKNLTDLLSHVLPEDQLREPHPLKHRIRQLGLRQCDLAFALGCTDGELSKWLNNRRQMPFTVEHRLKDLIVKLEAEV